jgi:uroporphyrinogen-III synthase
MEVVLCKEEKGPGDKYRQALEGAGYSPVFAPVLSFRWSGDDALDRLLLAAGGPAAWRGVVVTSPRAAQAAGRALRRLASRSAEGAAAAAAWPRGTTWFVVGKATVAALGAAAGSSELPSFLCEGAHTGSAKALAAYIVSHIIGSPPPPPSAVQGGISGGQSSAVEDGADGGTHQDAEVTIRRSEGDSAGTGAVASTAAEGEQPRPTALQEQQGPQGPPRWGSALLPVLFLCGNKRLDTIPSVLGVVGIAVREQVVYETMPADSIPVGPPPTTPPTPVVGDSTGGARGAFKQGTTMATGTAAAAPPPISTATATATTTVPSVTALPPYYGYCGTTRVVVLFSPSGVQVGKAQLVEWGCSALATDAANTGRHDCGENGSGGGGGGGGGDKGKRGGGQLSAAVPVKGQLSAAVPVKTLPRLVYDGDPLALIEMCEKDGSGDVGEARDLIARGVNIDVRDEEQYTALMAAAGNGHLEIVQDLVRAGAAVDVRNMDGWNALEIAQATCDTEEGAKVIAILKEATAAAVAAAAAAANDMVHYTDDLTGGEGEGKGGDGATDIGAVATAKSILSASASSFSSSSSPASASSSSSSSSATAHRRVGEIAVPVVRTVAIGKTTAAAMRELGIRVDAVASTPDPKGVLEAVASVVCLEPNG